MFAFKTVYRHLSASHTPLNPLRPQEFSVMCDWQPHGQQRRAVLSCEKRWNHSLEPMWKQYNLCFLSFLLLHSVTIKPKLRTKGFCSSLSRLYFADQWSKLIILLVFLYFVVMQFRKAVMTSVSRAGWKAVHLHSLTVKHRRQFIRGFLLFLYFNVFFCVWAFKSNLFFLASVSSLLSLHLYLQQLPKSSGCVSVISWRCVSCLPLKPWRPNCPACPTQLPRTTRPCCARWAS